MHKSAKAKLVIPILYVLATIIYFVSTWPATAYFYHYLGVAFTLLAFSFWITARIQLGDSFSIDAKAHRLITHGLYSKLRHPIYYFSICTVIGIGIYIWTVWIIIPTMILVILEAFRIRREEEVLTRSFGSKYQKYKKNTWF